MPALPKPSKPWACRSRGDTARALSREENIKVVQRSLALFTGGKDAAAQVFELFDSEVELHDHPGVPDAEWHKGYEGLVTWAGKFWEVFGDPDVHPAEFLEAPDGSLVVRIDWAAEGKQGGVRFDASHYSIWTLRNGKVLRIDQLETRAEALDAAGLSD